MSACRFAVPALLAIALAACGGGNGSKPRASDDDVLGGWPARYVGTLEAEDADWTATANVTWTYESSDSGGAYYGASGTLGMTPRPRTDGCVLQPPPTMSIDPGQLTVYLEDAPVPGSPSRHTFFASAPQGMTADLVCGGTTLAVPVIVPLTSTCQGLDGEIPHADPAQLSGSVVCDGWSASWNFKVQ